MSSELWVITQLPEAEVDSKSSTARILAAAIKDLRASESIRPREGIGEALRCYDGSEVDT